MADQPPLGRRIAAEAVSSFFLFACVIGSGIMAQNLSGGTTLSPCSAIRLQPAQSFSFSSPCSGLSRALT